MHTPCLFASCKQPKFIMIISSQRTPCFPHFKKAVKVIIARQFNRDVSDVTDRKGFSTQIFIIRDRLFLAINYKDNSTTLR